MSVFGMINWIYTWYNPRVDGNADVLARQMSDLLLSGVTARGQRLGGTPVRRRRLIRAASRRDAALHIAAKRSGRENSPRR